MGQGGKEGGCERERYKEEVLKEKAEESVFYSRIKKNMAKIT